MKSLLRGAVAVVLAGVAAGQATSRVSVGVLASSPSQGSLGVSASADGRFVAFQSVSSNLVPGDTNGAMDVFVVELATGLVERANVSSSGAQSSLSAVDPSISADGRFVAFSSFSADLVPGDANDKSDVFLRDRLSGTTERISVGPGGVEGDSQSYSPSVSGDGRFVAFQSHSSNLVPGASGQIFVLDRLFGQLTVASVDSVGQIASGGAYRPSISGDGRLVAFQSAATNLTPGDALPAAGGNGWDVFVHNQATGVTTHVSATPSGTYPNGGAQNPSISADGRFVAFESGATDIVAGDAPGSFDIFVRDLAAQQTVRASELFGGGNASGNSSGATLSSDGRYVGFSSSIPGLSSQATAPNTSQAYRRDLLAGTTEFVSASSCGVAGSGSSIGSASSYDTSISGDGARVFFVSFANTLVPGDVEGLADLFLRDFALPHGGVACSSCRSGTTSSGCVPSIQGSGVPSATSGSGFTIAVQAVEGERVGIAFFNGYAYYALPWAPNSTSYRCVNSAGRLPVASSGGTAGACDGLFAWDWNAHLAANPQLAALYAPGRQVFVQCWFRDPPAPTGTNLSDVLQFVMQ